ncbi:hypothetical protein [Lysinibacillus capsici]|uniref:hypothetical protein n=1 Tax=Lysinibacillus capsici TaxID=2115968 RepID=UPI001FC9DAD1|nr:hypothetical protein [Lysinibacillus capsici]
MQLIVEDKPQQTEEDDDIMKFTSTTTKAAVRDYIQQAVSKGLIDKSWLEKFDNGTITSGDFEGLKFSLHNVALNRKEPRYSIIFEAWAYF